MAKRVALFLLTVVVVSGALYAGARFAGARKAAAAVVPRPASVENPDAKVTVTGTQEEAAKHPAMAVAQKVAEIPPALALCDPDAWSKKMEPLAAPGAIEGLLMFMKLADIQAALEAKTAEEATRVADEKSHFCAAFADAMSKGGPTYYDMRLLVSNNDTATVYWRWGFESSPDNSWPQRWVLLKNEGGKWQYAGEDFTRGTWAIGRDGVTWYSRPILSDSKPGGK